MNKLRTGGVAIAFGLASYGGMAMMMDYGEAPTSQVNAQVRACARVLGNAAIETPIVPTACQNTVDGDDMFNPTDRQTSKGMITEYHLPAATDFLADYIISPQQAQNDEKIDRNIKIGLALFGGFLAGVSSATARPRKRQIPAVPNIEAS